MIRRYGPEQLDRLTVNQATLSICRPWLEPVRWWCRAEDGERKPEGTWEWNPAQKPPHAGIVLFAAGEIGILFTLKRSKRQLRGKAWYTYEETIGETRVEKQVVCENFVALVGEGLNDKLNAWCISELIADVVTQSEILAHGGLRTVVDGEMRI